MLTDASSTSFDALCILLAKPGMTRSASSGGTGRTRPRGRTARFSEADGEAPLQSPRRVAAIAEFLVARPFGAPLHFVLTWPRHLTDEIPHGSAQAA